MNIPASATTTLAIVYGLHRLIERNVSPMDDFTAFGVLMVLGFAGICCYIVKASSDDRQRFNGMKF